MVLMMGAYLCVNETTTLQYIFFRLRKKLYKICIKISRVMGNTRKCLKVGSMVCFYKVEAMLNGTESEKVMETASCPGGSKFHVVLWSLLVHACQCERSGAAHSVLCKTHHGLLET